MARPTKFKSEYCDEVYELCLLGYTDKELSDYYRIAESTLNLWKEKHPEFMDALRDGKSGADREIAKSLYKKAKEGDTTAQIFWLKNRRRQHWRDKYDTTISDPDGNPISIVYKPHES